MFIEIQNCLINTNAIKKIYKSQDVNLVIKFTNDNKETFVFESFDKREKAYYSLTNALLDYGKLIEIG